MNHHERIRIFLADDDHDDTFLFREALEQITLPTELTIAHNGMELLQIMASSTTRPDIIFLDMNMPVKNGLECLQEIRATPGYDQVRVIILSTSVAQGLWESAYKGGANLYIQKPTSFTGLVEILQKYLLHETEHNVPEHVEQFLITN